MATWTRKGPGPMPGSNTYTDGVYVVTRGDLPGGMIHLSFSRVDRGALMDWREKQRIKNEIVGPEHEAVELYPAESRKVDGANQFHLWVIAAKGQRFAFGFDERLVTDEPPLPGCTQRPGSGATPEDQRRVTDMMAEARTNGLPVAGGRLHIDVKG